MVIKTFSAQVADGQLHHQESLADLEGQEVRVTLIAPTSTPAGASTSQVPGSDEPPEWMDVEKDVYVKMPFRGELLRDVTIIDGGPMRPCIILPEELPDE